MEACSYGSGYGVSSEYTPSWDGTESLGIENLNNVSGGYRDDDRDGERHPSHGPRHDSRHHKHDSDDE